MEQIPSTPTNRFAIKPRTIIVFGVFIALVLAGIMLTFVPRLMAQNQSEPTVEPTARATSTPRPTATSVPTEIPTLAPPTPAPDVVLPTPTAVTPITLCEDGSNLLAPREGDTFTVGATVVFSGTANLPVDYSYYKIQYQTILTADPDLWAEAYRSEEHPEKPFYPPTPVPEPSVLARWNTSAVEPGTYRVRLVVLDKYSNTPIKPCTILIKLTVP